MESMDPPPPRGQPAQYVPLRSIAFAYACFDRKDKGINGLPGKAVNASLEFGCVFFFRICEILSRCFQMEQSTF